jgi:hypothetical protein
VIDPFKAKNDLVKLLTLVASTDLVEIIILCVRWYLRIYPPLLSGEPDGLMLGTWQRVVCQQRLADALSVRWLRFLYLAGGAHALHSNLCVL